MQAGTKDLKNRLSHYLRLVRAGEVVDVTDRGEVVAQLRPPARAPRPSDEAVLDALERDGAISRGRGRARDIEPAPRKRGSKTLSEMIIEDRG